VIISRETSKAAIAPKAGRSRQFVPTAPDLRAVSRRRRSCAAAPPTTTTTGTSLIMPATTLDPETVRVGGRV
jgi:hypothetical protein